MRVYIETLPVIFHNGHNIELLDVSDMMAFEDCYESKEAEPD